MTGTASAQPLAGGLADALELALCAVDGTGTILEVNRRWVDVVAPAGGPDGTGRPFATWAGVVHPPWAEVVGRAGELLAEVLAGRVSRGGARHSVTVNDRLREIDLEVRRLDRPTASGARVLISVQDVTDRMWAHHLSADQQRDHERALLVARYSDSAIAVLDLDGVIEWVSDTFVALTGVPRQEAVGRSRWELLRGPFLHTDAYRRFEAELHAGRPTAVEAPMHRPDGSLYWSSWRVQPMSEGGRVVKLLSIERDITKRRRAEETARQTLIRAQRLGAELRQEKHLVSSVLSTAPLAVWWKGPDLTYLGCNQGFVELRGLSSAAEVIGRREEDLGVSDVFGSRLGALEEQVISGGEPVTQQRITVAEPGRPMLTYLMSVLPRAENRKVVGTLGVCADVSQMAELERQLSQSSRLESIGQLAAGIAHEINTPVQYASDNVRFAAESFVTLIDGVKTLEALAAGCADPELRDRVATVLQDLDLDFLADEVPSALAQSQEGLGRVAQIVRAMKEFSHPGGERTPTDLNHLVESTVQVSRNEWKYVARLVQELDPEVGEVRCYAGDLKQALLNILVNAAHAVDERRRLQGTDQLGLITVRTARTPTEVRIDVTDDGIGMDEDVRNRIFDPFFTTKQVGKGTGQGLSLAHSAVVTKHHGRIEVESAPLQGSRFSIVLPVSGQDGRPGKETVR